MWLLMCPVISQNLAWSLLLDLFQSIGKTRTRFSSSCHVPYRDYMAALSSLPSYGHWLILLFACWLKWIAEQRDIASRVLYKYIRLFSCKLTVSSTDQTEFIMTKRRGAHFSTKMIGGVIFFCRLCVSTPPPLINSDREAWGSNFLLKDHCWCVP